MNFHNSECGFSIDAMRSTNKMFNKNLKLIKLSTQRVDKFDHFINNRRDKTIKKRLSQIRAFYYSRCHLMESLCDLEKLIIVTIQI